MAQAGPQLSHHPQRGRRRARPANGLNRERLEGPSTQSAGSVVCTPSTLYPRQLNCSRPSVIAEAEAEEEEEK